MSVKDGRQAKLETLQEQGVAHRTPARVKDALFQNNVFFDPHDAVQVKYEMLRRVRVEKTTIAMAATAFGFSRVSFYQIRQRFAQEGLAGLLPRARGPREAHKLSTKVLVYLDKEIEREGGVKAVSLAEKVEARFGLSVHSRSIERALSRRQKKRLS